MYELISLKPAFLPGQDRAIFFKIKQEYSQQLKDTVYSLLETNVAERPNVDEVLSAISKCEHVDQDLLQKSLSID